MGNYMSCADCNKFTCWLCEQRDKNWFLLLLAFGGAFLLVYNCHLGFTLIEQFCGNTEQQHTQLRALPTGDGVAYGARSGPHTWSTANNNQSPINIDSNCLEVRTFDNPLLWMGYQELPLGIRLQNDGNTLLLHAAFPEEAPYIDGGDLLGTFRFYQISFRWSWYNEFGSEHTLDNQHFPLEMQCLHTNVINPRHASSRGLLMVSYVFSLSTDNPYLDVIIQHLVAVQEFEKSVEIPPFPLNYLMPPFYTQFFSYQGSLTEPPCHRGAEWFIHPIPLAIGERQLHEFRKLRRRNGARITRNARPVQALGDRSVYLNVYENNS